MSNVSFRPDGVTLPCCSGAAKGSGNSGTTLSTDQFETECFLGFLQYKIIYETLPILKKPFAFCTYFSAAKK